MWGRLMEKDYNNVLKQFEDCNDDEKSIKEIFRRRKFSRVGD